MISTSKSRRLVMSVSTAAALAGGTLVGVAAPAHAICDVDRVVYSTPYAGGKVWIPTSTASDWKRGGTITRQVSDGESTATTRGSSHSIGADGSVGGKLGPVELGVTVKYNYTWNKSTTKTTSVTRGWAYTFNVPTDQLYRARAYKLGRLFKYKRTTYYLGGCAPRSSWSYAAAPLKSNTGTYYWALERYDRKGKLRYDGLR